MWEALKQLKREGYQIDEEDVKHLSPARYEHLNVLENTASRCRKNWAGNVCARSDDLAMMNNPVRRNRKRCFLSSC
jgi:hypothetical protein